MSHEISGKTRIFMTLGHPISQVKSPGDITECFGDRNVDAVHIPLEVTPDGIDEFLIAINKCTNVDGLVMTIPYKFKGAKMCSTLSPRATLLGATNILRRNKDDSWHGDITDGIGFCNAIEQTGSKIQDRSALLIGAGGAGSAIGLALLDRGISALNIYDIDQGRASKLSNLLRTKYPNIVHTVTAPQPVGSDIIAHASPTGMKKGDPLPLDIKTLDGSMHVGDVVTEPVLTPLLQFAKELGCSIHTGIQMWKEQQDVVVDFLLHQETKDNF
jgi:shikimate dehydrogenase